MCGSVELASCRMCSTPGCEQPTITMPPFEALIARESSFSSKPDPEVACIATVLHDDVKLERVAPGHCTGEPEFAALKKAFGDKYVYADTVVGLP